MKLRHVALVVNDLNKMVDFYKKVFRVDPSERGVLESQLVDKITGLRRCKLEFVKFTIGKGVFELVKYYRPPISPMKTRSHIAYTVENIAEEQRRLKTLGCKFFSVAEEMPGGKVKMTYGEDIEGNLMEIVEELK